MTGKGSLDFMHRYSFIFLRKWGGREGRSERLLVEEVIKGG